MLAAKYDITIDRAAEYSFVLTIQNPAGTAVDIGTYTFYAEARDAVTKKQAVVFATSILDGGDNGQVKFSLSEANTLTLKPAGSYEYDIFMKSTGDVMQRLLYGSMTVRQNFYKGVPVDPLP